LIIVDVSASTGAFVGTVNIELLNLHDDPSGPDNHTCHTVWRDI